jgi:seryl-tRNA synthetase
MLDLRRLRSEPDAVRAALARRGDGSDALVDTFLEVDNEWRSLTANVESHRAMQNEASEDVAAGKRAGADVSSQLAGLKQMADQIKVWNAQLKDAERRRNAIVNRFPNTPAEQAPDSDTVIREVGEAGREGRDHLELAGERIDMERGARLSGSRFAYLRGDLVVLEFALVQWALHKLRAHGFEPVIPPVLVREEALYGTGFLPDTEQQIYTVGDDELYLVGTSEVALASLHAGEILEELPLRYAAFSSCFRREAGAAGKDTRGIFRVHQFDKVEMFSFVTPDESAAEHERLLAIEEEILGELGVPYRVVDIAVNDLGASAARKFDCEAWMPGQARYREVTSTSNTTDFQARRLEIRHRPADAKRPEVAHTLNGTAVTWRHMIALLENGQRDDGGVDLPEVLTAFGAPASLEPAG